MTPRAPSRYDAPVTRRPPADRGLGAGTRPPDAPPPYAGPWPYTPRASAADVLADVLGPPDDPPSASGELLAFVLPDSSGVRWAAVCMVDAAERLALGSDPERPRVTRHAGRHPRKLDARHVLGGFRRGYADGLRGMHRPARSVYGDRPRRVGYALGQARARRFDPKRASGIRKGLELWGVAWPDVVQAADAVREDARKGGGSRPMIAPD